jgi:hypothetical protein
MKVCLETTFVERLHAARNGRGHNLDNDPTQPVALSLSPHQRESMSTLLARPHESRYQSRRPRPTLVPAMTFIPQSAFSRPARSITIGASVE